MQTAAKVCGVELSKTRYDNCMSASRKAKQQFGKDLLNRLSFIKDDMTTVNLKNATVIYMNSVCYNGESMTKLRNMFGNLRKLPNLRMIATFQDFSGPPKGFESAGTIQVKCTWSDAVTVNIYKRNR
jgi:hypothetical protein